MKLKKGDTVQVIRGKDKDKTSKVVMVMTKLNKVLVENVNQYKRHVKKRTQNDKSEIVTITKPLPVSNVALVCPKCKQLTRVGYEEEQEEKYRVCRKCGQRI